MLPADFSPLYAPHAPENSLCIAFVGDDLLLTQDNTFPDSAQLAGLPPAETDCLIGQLGEQTCRLLAWPGSIEAPAGLQRLNLRLAWNLLDREQYALATRAKLMLSWDREHRFCGVCGTPTVPMESEPARICPACQHRAYPRLSPAIMVLIHRGNELLLARSPHFRPGMYSAVAGFVEPGESLEECAHREVMEEVGVRITNLRWFDSQPWPFPHSLMLAFHADYVEGDIVPQPGEIEDAAWFHVDALPDLPNSDSIAYRLLQSAINEKKHAL
ncbi:MAG: hypothetical protein H6R07_291 [Proteobacteria bacterium]|nr:hypothetical protein [Pseudomonadota bacterium]